MRQILLVGLHAHCDIRLLDMDALRHGLLFLGALGRVNAEACS